MILIIAMVLVVLVPMIMLAISDMIDDKEIAAMNEKNREFFKDKFNKKFGAIINGEPKSI